MNNTQFRHLVLDTPTVGSKSHDGRDGRDVGVRHSAANASALGSRMRSSMPMTPRSVIGSKPTDFARQLAERNGHPDGGQDRKFRSSAAPKGSRLPAGYQDRTQSRRSNEEDDKTRRVQALEDMVRLGQMNHSDFQKLRDEIIGGDVHDVHLVKGLDYKLLERVKRGEDVLANHEENSNAPPAPSSAVSENEMEAELGELEEKAVVPLSKQETIKKGQLAPLASMRKGTMRSRNDILKDLKAARSAAKSAPSPPQPLLGTKFKKVGTMKEQSRIEIDDRGREILLMVDADGVTKRKIRKLDPVSTSESRESLPMPRQDVAPLGSELILPDTQEPSVEEVKDIFEGVGADFNPLGDLDGSDEDGDGQGDDSASDRGAAEPEREKLEQDEKAPAVPSLVSRSADREVQNYFNEPNPLQQVEARHDYLTDPAIVAALKKASSIQPLASERPTDEGAAAKLARHKRLLESQDRDADDLDMGFDLSNRFDDDEDAGAGKAPKLSVWDNELDRGEKDERRKRKGEQPEKGSQKSKKKKRNVDDAATVLKVLGQKGPKGEAK